MQGERDRALLAAIIESSDDAIISLHLDGTISSWNRAAERLFGYTETEAIGSSVTLLMPEDRKDEASLILGQVRRGQRVAHYDTVRRHKNGTPVDISLTVSPIRDSSGTIIGASKIARDVTECHRATEELKRSQQEYARLANLLPVGVYMCDAPRGVITYYNDQAAHLWGRTPGAGESDERFCGSLRMYLPGRDTPLPHDEGPMAVALREGRSFRNQEVVIERPDGSRISALVNIDPLRDSSGTVIGAINVFNDVTELKRIEKAFTEERENLGTLLETLPVAVFLAHDAACKRITGNAAAHRLLRVPQPANLSLSAPLEEAPSHFSVLKDGTPVEPGDLPIQRAARGETVLDEAVDLQFGDGTTIHALVSAQPLFASSGSPRVAVACMLDVTDLKLVEHTLRQHDRRKDEFLATLAHELRNPLAPIVAGLEVMQMAKEDPQTVERARRTIDRQVHHLVMLVDDLLDVSRITEGKFELRMRTVEVSEVVNVAVESALPPSQRAGLTLTTVLPEEPVHLRADPHRLAQVLSNLLSNAVKYTPPGGRIDLRVAVVGDSVEISVTDTGIGIPPEMTDGIFEMFTQIDRPQERGHPGLGVGLTLVRVLVDMHGGSVTVASGGTDRGSRFTVRLPLAATEPQASAALDVPDSTFGNAHTRRVLVVDDNEAMVHALTTMLQLMGSEVRTAFDGRHAVEVAAEFRPDTVLMDLGMPVMSGYEAARRIRAQPWGSEMQLVALTGWDQEDHKARSSEAGFDVHVVKPVRPADLERLFDSSGGEIGRDTSRKLTTG